MVLGGFGWFAVLVVTVDHILCLYFLELTDGKIYRENNVN